VRYELLQLQLLHIQKICTVFVLKYSNF
jgi:hypothetical protein